MTDIFHDAETSSTGRSLKEAPGKPTWATIRTSVSREYTP